jgi:hypothetical protein
MYQFMVKNFVIFFVSDVTNKISTMLHKGMRQNSELLTNCYNRLTDYRFHQFNPSLVLVLQLVPVHFISLSKTVNQIS